MCFMPLSGVGPPDLDTTLAESRRFRSISLNQSVSIRQKSRDPTVLTVDGNRRFLAACESRRFLLRWLFHDVSLCVLDRPDKKQVM